MYSDTTLDHYGIDLVCFPFKLLGNVWLNLHLERVGTGGEEVSGALLLLTQILVLVYWPNNCFDIRETFINALLPLIKNNPGCVNGSADVAANIEPALHPRVEIAVARGFETLSRSVPRQGLLLR